MTVPQPAKLGPFIGGMNIASDPASVSDNELVDCLNFELDLDGSLASRPPIVETTGNVAWTRRIVMIGRAMLAGGSYVIGSNMDGVYAFNGTSWVTIKTGLKSRCAIQYQDYVFIVATVDSPSNGGYWDGTTFTVDNNMPRGDAAVFHKSRMWVVPGQNQTGKLAHQLRYTYIIDLANPVPLDWTDKATPTPATNIIGVGIGDGQNLMDIVVHQDNLLLFKQNSTYAYVYDVFISDAVLRVVNTNLGASSYHCVAQFENSTFMYDDGVIYEIQNYDFKPISNKIPLKGVASPNLEEIFINVVGNRLLVRYFDYVYSYGLTTKTWSRWDSASAVLRTFGPWVEFPTQPSQFQFHTYYSGSVKTNNKNFFVLKDGYGAAQEKTLDNTLYRIKCTITTKNYDFGDPMHFKKLKWWGLDCLSVNAVEGVATPVVLDFRTRWMDVHNKTWDNMATGTWDNPLPHAVAVDDPVADVSIFMRKFIKFLKALRFRQINFHVEMITDGSTSEGPCNLFSLVAIVGLKEAVVAKVS